MNTLPFEELYKEEMSFIIAKQQADQVGPISLIKDLYEQPLIIGGESCLYHIKLQKEPLKNKCGAVHLHRQPDFSDSIISKEIPLCRSYPFFYSIVRRICESSN